MIDERRNYFVTKNISSIRLVVSLLALAIFMIFLQNYNDSAFAQTDDEISLYSNSSNETVPGSVVSNQSIPDSQSLSGFVAKGKINTIITVPKGKWLADGNWSLILDNGNVTSFETKMIWYNSSGSNAHTHELTGFSPIPNNIQMLPKQITIKGNTDVGANNKISWVQVPTTITINDRKIISISVDDAKTNKHFGGQPLLGIVDSFVPCSDVPGPNMELLPACSTSTSGEESFGQTNNNTLPYSGSDELPPYQGGYPTGDQFPPFEDQSGQGQGQFPPFEDQSGQGQGQGQGQFPPFEDQSGQGQGQGQGQFPPFEDQSGQGQDTQSAPEINPECIDLNIKNITASGFESDPSDYHPPSDAIDGDSSTWWSNNGKVPWVEIDLGKHQTICGVSVQWNKGDHRNYSFEIEVSQDGNDYKKVFEGKNDKGSTKPETYPLDQETEAQYIKLSITGTSSKDGWASIQEISALGLPDH
jgi:hypothetical protein